MSSYILFSQTSTALGQRDKWTDAGNSGGVQAPGNTAAASTFSADQVGSPLLDTVGEVADYADGVRKDATTALFDISQTAGGAFTPGGAGGAAAADALDAGGPLFGNASSQVATSVINEVSGELTLTQSDANWNGIKNLEIMLDSNSTFRDIYLENFVDTRLKIGDDACALTVQRQPDIFDVAMVGVKRGEFDGSFAAGEINLGIDVWSNEKTWQNSFDLKGGVYGDDFKIGAGNVTGSSFKGVAATHDGTGTTVFSNMGAGDDSYDSTVCAGFKARDKVWGGTGDDVVKTGAGDDKLFGDNGSGTDAYADPASLRDPASCTPIPGAEGNDDLDAGAGADCVQGDGDRGAISLIAAGLDIIVNGGFENFDTNPDVETISHDGGGWFEFKELAIDNVPGWDADTANHGPIEIQLNPTGGLAAHSGVAKLELDSHNSFGPKTNAIVSQNLNALTGETYTLDFFYSPRFPDLNPAAIFPSGSSSFEVVWNGATVFTFTDPGIGLAGWQQFTVDVVGGAGLDTLEFRALGEENTLGAFIDDVSLKAKHAFLDLGGAGDEIFLGLNDLAKDTVKYTEANGDGFDVVRQFEKGVDKVAMDLVGAPGTATITEVMTAEGLSTLISLNADPTHGVLIVGQTGLVVGTDIIFS